MNHIGEAVHVESDVWFIPFCGMYWRFSRANMEAVARMCLDITSVHPPSFPVRDGKMVFTENPDFIMLSYVEHEEGESKYMRGIFCINTTYPKYRELLREIREMLMDALDLPLITYEDRAIVEKIQKNIKPFNFID